jgi:hypothetical protein
MDHIEAGKRTRPTRIQSTPLDTRCHLEAAHRVETRDLETPIELFSLGGQLQSVWAALQSAVLSACTGIWRILRIL